MRRIAAFLVLMAAAVAGRLNAQAVTPCGQFSIARTFPATGRVHFTAQGDCTIPRDTVRLPDSTALKAAQQALRDTTQVAVQLRSALKIATDSLAKWPKATPPKDSTVTPPKDTTPPPPPPTDTTPAPSGTLFRSDWSTATGSTDAALTDGGKWTNHAACSEQASLAVVPNPGTFPAAMRNVLRVRMGLQVTGGTNCDWAQAHNLWPVPAVGQSIALRLYMRHEVADADGDKGGGYAATHPVESGFDAGTGGGFWEWKLGSSANGTFPLSFETSGAVFSFGKSNQAAPAPVKKFVTWRWEWKFTRRAAGRYDLDIRVYDQTGALVYDKSSIYANWGSTTTLATAGLNLAIDDAQIRNFRVGINGGFATSSPQFVYYGGAAVCTDWCGAY